MFISDYEIVDQKNIGIMSRYARNLVKYLPLFMS